MVHVYRLMGEFSQNCKLFQHICSHPSCCRFGTDRAGIPTTYGDTHTSQKRAPVAEPNIDFELDIKLDVDCGKCVLHSKELETEGKRWVSGELGETCLQILEFVEFSIGPRGSCSPAKNIFFLVQFCKC